MKFLFAKPALALDLGSKAVKGIQLSKKSGRVQMDGYFYQDFNQDEKSTGESVLAALIARRGLQKTKAYASISDNRLLNFNLQLPKMPQKELTIAIRNEVETHLSFNAQDAVIDYLSPRESLSQDGIPGFSISAFCVKRSDVAGKVRSLESAQLIPEAVEANIFANISTLDFNDYLSSPDQSDILIDLGYSHTTIALLNDATPMLINVLPYGGRYISEALAAEFAMDLDEIDRLKRLSTAKALSARTENPKFWSKLDEKRSFLREEIAKSIHFFMEHSLKHPIAKVLLIGGDGPGHELAQSFGETFGLPTEMVDPLRKIALHSSLNDQSAEIGNHAPYLSVAVGLGLRGLT